VTDFSGAGIFSSVFGWCPSCEAAVCLILKKIEQTKGAKIIYLKLASEIKIAQLNHLLMIIS
jgi:hypothetical protein